MRRTFMDVRHIIQSFHAGTVDDDDDELMAARLLL